MRKFTEADIEKMLSKTEKTSPAFDKKVNFNEKQIMPLRRRRYGAILAAACVLVVTVSVLTVFMLTNREGDIEASIPDTSYSQFVSGVSQYPPSESSGFTNESYDFPELSEGQMSTAGDSSENISETSQEAEKNPVVAYPKDNAFYVGQGVGYNQTAEEYLKANPHEYLGSRLKLSVYARQSLVLDERKATLNKFSEALGMQFLFDESMYNITGDCRGLSEDKHYSINASEYGDWYFIAYTVNFLSVKTNAELAPFESAVKGFVEKNSQLFEQGEFNYTVELKGDRVYVNVFNNGRSDAITKKMIAYTFAFKKNTETRYSLASIVYNCAGDSLGEYKTALYDDALNQMFANEFYSEHGFAFGSEDTFRIVGYDVRYLTSNSESLVCPYYAFVVQINPSSENSYLRTLFVPAIVNDSIEKESSEEEIG